MPPPNKLPLPLPFSSFSFLIKPPPFLKTPTTPLPLLRPHSSLLHSLSYFPGKPHFRSFSSSSSSSLSTSTSTSLDDFEPLSSTTTTLQPQPQPQPQQEEDDLEDDVEEIEDEEIEEGEGEEENSHPWPEWVSFIDRLKTKGYFYSANNNNNEYDNIISDNNDKKLDYGEYTLVKDPCLRFARDRYDIFRSLPKEDIQGIVEGGCPKVKRKVVNSAKRLRFYLGLDEAKVCTGCSLRKSCDRAFVTVKETEDEGDRLTLDVMRLLLVYALDPSVISGTETALSATARIKKANFSARRLLSMLSDLGELAPVKLSEEDEDKPVRKRLVRTPKVHDTSSQDFELKRGDWVCPECDYKNFSRNVQCRNCKSGSKPAPPSVQEGDWSCPECSYVNFSKNLSCRKCSITRPVSQSADQAEMKRGDWNCPTCGCMNFASRRNCFRCKESRPPRALEPGEWECPKCDFLNFRRNSSCLKCNSEKPEVAASTYNNRKPPRTTDPEDWECPECNFLNFKRNTACRKCSVERPRVQMSPYDELTWKSSQ